MHANGVHYTNDGHLLVSGKVDKNGADKTKEDVGGGRGDDEADQAERR